MNDELINKYLVAYSLVAKSLTSAIYRELNALFEHEYHGEFPSTISIATHNVGVILKRNHLITKSACTCKGCI